MAAIYDKSLKRKDFSGIIDEQKAQHAADRKSAAASAASGVPPTKPSAKPPSAKADQKKATAGAGKLAHLKELCLADVGGIDIAKIVNLMSGDADQIATIVSELHGLYGAPLEFLFGSIFLYQLLVRCFMYTASG
jgi:hypothetical protein